MLLTQQDYSTLIKNRFAMKTTTNFDAISNRLKKRYRHLAKWAKGQRIDYFRLYDRDLPEAPLVIDALPNHWVVWVTEHVASDETDLLVQVKQTLCELNDGEIIIKHRKKKNDIKQHYFQEDTIIEVQEGGLTFKLNLTRYLDVGLFIDHRNARQLIRKEATGKRVLNLFAYTGSFGCYALAGGANFVTSVDLNPRYSEWQEENYKLNHFKPNQYSIVTADVMQFLTNNKSKYDIVICDPPSFSHSKRKGAKLFQIQDDANTLIKGCLKALKPTGWLFFSTNYRRFNMDKAIDGLSIQVNELSRQLVSKDFEAAAPARSWRLSKTS